MSSDLSWNGTKYSENGTIRTINSYGSITQIVRPYQGEIGLPNGNFETWVTSGSLSYWNNIYNIERNSNPYNGSFCLAMGITAANDFKSIDYWNLYLEPYGTYIVRFWAKGNSAISCRVDLLYNGTVFYDNTTKTWGAAAYNMTFNLTTNWQLCEGEFYCGSRGAESGSVTIKLARVTAPSGTFYFDFLEVRKKYYTAQLDCAWGQRLAEMSGLMKGISGIGTAIYEGTYEEFFPDGYFKDVPILNVLYRVPKKGIRNGAIGAEENSGIWLYPEDSIMPGMDANYDSSGYDVWRIPRVEDIFILRISTTSFSIVQNGRISMAEDEWKDRNTVFYYHAFGSVG